MAKRVFKGFTEQQMAALGQKVGFNGPLEKLNDFLRSSPEAAAKFGLLSQKAKQIAEGVKTYADGGLVVGDKVPYAKSSSAVQTQTQQKQAGSVTPGALAQTATIAPTEDQFINGNTGMQGPVVGGSIPELPKIPTQQKPTAGYNPATSTGQVKQEASNFNGVEGQVSQAGQITAAQKDPNTLSQLGLEVPQISEQDKKEATVQQQLTGLMDQFEGGQTPPWAAGALRRVSAAMAARGVDSSSMVAQAMTQAAMEAATAIAAADAQLIGQTNLANLDVRKSKMLSDAAAMASMDLANLNNRQQAAVENAKAFLEMDFKNLDNKQQAEIFSFQSVVNSLLSDAAQENAAKQFNASSENQMTQFFSQLASSVEISRAELLADTSKFNATMLNQREQFNATNALAIAQANTQWRQQISTVNTAAQNLTNQLNATTIAKMSETAFNAMIQLERDEMAFINDALTRATQVGENAADRENRLLIASLDRDAAKKLADQGYKFEAGKAIGGAITGLAVDGIRSLFGF